MSVFVTGTDTGVGKTVIAAALSLKLGWRYWKPVQCGTSEGTDRAWVSERLGAAQTIPEAFCLQAPLAPEQAAKLENLHEPIRVSKILAHKLAEPLVIEGAGGLMVPLNDHEFILDLISALQIPVIVVARSGLGTINHSLLTITALRERNIEIRGLIMVGKPNSLNRQSIERFSQIRVLAEVPLMAQLNKNNLQQIADSICLGGEK